jgi:hypothetical protein
MNATLKDKLRTIFYPLVLVKRVMYNQYLEYLGLYNPKKLASILHYDYCKRHIDWDNPKDLNEKINWLKFNSDTTLWSELSDKYAVRKYIEEVGLGEMLVKLYGVWSFVEDIDFDKLPQSFVLKSTNGSGTVMVVKDKSALNLIEVKLMLNGWLKQKFGIMTAEPHYFPIRPQIIAEELLINDQKDVSSSLIDYKFWCFHGEPYSVWSCSNRKIGGETYVASHDLGWKIYAEHSVFVDHYRKCENNIPKPKSLEKMIEACKIITKDFPQVRLDFYEANGEPYFGEMTFTSSGGYMDWYTKEYLLEMGSQIKLPEKHK